MNRHLSQLLLCVCLLAAGPYTLASESAIQNPFFVFADGLGQQAPEAQVTLARKIGFPGISFDGVPLLRERLEALDAQGLQLFCLYLYVDVGGTAPQYEPGLADAIALLKGRGTLVWLIVRGQGPQAEAQAVESARYVSDLASAANLRVALYPHYGLYVHTVRDALRIAEKSGRSNLGVTFNLCHELRSGQEAADLKLVLKQNMHRLYAVSINGADTHGKDWDTLIQPLDRGDFDVPGLLRTLVNHGYRGPIGLQCFAIKGDPEDFLKRSMTSWHAMSQRVDAEPHPDATR